MPTIIYDRGIHKFIIVKKLVGLLSLIVALGFTTNLFSQQALTVRGTVKAATGETLPGVTIVVQGTETGTISTSDGTFLIQVPDVNSVLVFSYIGYGTVQEALNGRTTVDVVLTESYEALEEVVVVGYGTQRRANLTGAVDQVSGEEFDNRTPD